MMGTQQSIVTEDFVRDMNSENGTLNNHHNVLNEPFYNLIGNQTKIFEELGKRLCIELQTSYQEYLKNSDDIGKICKKYEDKIDSQSKLIEFLRARIEELETETITKNQEINKLRQETGELRRDIQVIPENDDKQPAKDASSLMKDENGKDEPLTTVSNALETLEDKDQELSEDDDFYEEEFTEIPYVICDGELYYKEGHKEEMAEPSSGKNDITTSLELKQESTKPRSLKTPNINSAEMQRLVEHKLPKNKTVRKSQNENTNEFIQSFQCFHSKIQEKLERVNGKGQNHAKSNELTTLVERFSVKFLLEYEESNEFQSLDKHSQNLIKLIINGKLRDEVNDVTKKISQPFNVYSDRRIIPPLPDGIKSYSEFVNTNKFNSLSEECQNRIRKIISAENDKLLYI